MTEHAGERRRLVLITTVADTAWMLLRGQPRFLTEQGFDVTVVSAPSELLAAVSDREGVPVVSVPMRREISPLADLVALVRLIVTLRRLRPDVVVSGTPKAGLLGGVAARVLRVRLRIYLLRGLRLETAHGLLGKLLWCAERIAIMSAHVTVAVSPSLRAKAHEIGLVKGDRAVVLGSGASNGVDLERFAAPANAANLRSRLGIAPSTFVFGFVGRITRDKGVDDLIQAYTRLVAHRPNTALLLLGADDEQRTLSAFTLRALATTPSVRRLDWMPDPAAIYTVIDALVLPTYREGFPNVVLEAGAAGKPVITTRATGAIDSVRDGSTGLLVDVQDAEQLHNAMQRLCDDPRSAQEMGRRNLAFVRANFSNDLVWRTFAEFVIHELAERPCCSARPRLPKFRT